MSVRDSLILVLRKAMFARYVALLGHRGLHLLMSALSAVSCLALLRAVMGIPNQAQHPRQVGCYHGFYVLFILTPGNLRKCKYYSSHFAPGQLGLDMISDQRRVGSGSTWYWK